jgi:hypothetical protein
MTTLGVRDRIAAVLVAAATLVYVLWLVGVPGGLTAGSVALVVLALGFVASASAVVPGFAALLRGSRRYLALTSIGGVVALVAGLLTVIQASELTLAVLVVATVALWAAATYRHATAHERRPAVSG